MYCGKMEIDKRAASQDVIDNIKEDLLENNLDWRIAVNLVIGKMWVRWQMWVHWHLGIFEYLLYYSDIIQAAIALAMPIVN